MGGALLGKPLGDLESVDRVNPLESFCDKARLIALQGADEVPFQIRKGCFTNLVYTFLHIVLAKRLLTGARSLLNVRSRPGLGDGQKRDLFGLPPTAPRGFADTRENGLQVG